MLRLRADETLCIALSMLIAISGCGTGTHDHQSANYIAPAATASAPLPDRYMVPPSAAYVVNTAQPAEFNERVGDSQKMPADLGTGPGTGGDRFAYVPENDFVAVSAQPLSTFSIDVDTASYSKTRMYLMQQHALPPVDAIRIEEFVNYFQYSYAPPTNDDPFAVHVEVAECPWKQTHLLARVGLKGREVEQQRPAGNLVFLLDVSGSMDAPNKLGLVQQSMRMLTSQLSNHDRVSIVVYAGAAGLVLPSTYGDRRSEIQTAIDNLHAGGSTNGGAGIQLAYRIAKENMIAGGVNRVILCTDGDFNVGVTSTGSLVRMAEAEAKAGVFLTVLGFGMGNHNDAMLEEISSKANGAYAFIDSEMEARKMFVEQINSTLVTIAKDVKIQIEFNPTSVASYRLIGYENRLLAAQDFNNDRKDAGEIGAGHTVTALYELVPHGGEEAANTGRVDPLKYQTKFEKIEKIEKTEKTELPEYTNNELMTVKLRYKQPDGSTSRLISQAVANTDRRFGEASNDFRFAASVASFGMLLRHSAYAGDTSPDAILEIAGAALGNDPNGHRREFIELIKVAKQITGGEPVAGAVVSPPMVTYTTPRIQYVHHTNYAYAFAFWGMVALWIGSALVGLMFLVVAWRCWLNRSTVPSYAPQKMKWATDETQMKHR